MKILRTIRRLSRSRRPRRNFWLVDVKVTILAATFSCLVGPAAAQNTWNGGNGNWSTGSDWSTGTSPDESTDISIGEGIVQGDVSFTNCSILDIRPSGELILLSTTTITNSTSSGQILNAGSLVHQGILNSDSSASITIYGSGSISNSFGAEMNIVGEVTNKDDAMLYNAGTLTLGLSIDGGTVNNVGTLTVSDLFINKGTVNNTAGTTQIGCSYSTGRETIFSWM